MDYEIAVAKALGLIDVTLGSVRDYSKEDLSRRLAMIAATLRENETEAERLSRIDGARQNELDNKAEQTAPLFTAHMPVIDDEGNRVSLMLYVDQNEEGQTEYMQFVESDDDLDDSPLNQIVECDSYTDGVKWALEVIRRVQIGDELIRSIPLEPDLTGKVFNFGCENCEGEEEKVLDSAPEI